VFNFDVTCYFERLENNRILSSGPVIDESVHICNYHMSACFFSKIILRKVTGVLGFQNLTSCDPEHI
jgi:hypothetical protein